MKKTVSLALALLLLLALFSACGSGGASSPAVSSTEPVSSATEPTTAPVQEPVADDPGTDEPEALPYSLPVTDNSVTLSYWGNLSSATLNYINGFEDTQMFQQLSERTGVNFEFFSTTAAAMREQFQIMTASGEYYDIVKDFMNLYTGSKDSAVADGLALDLAPYMQDYAPNYYNYVVGEGLEKDITSDTGKIVAFNLIFSGPNKYTTGIVIRQDWLDKVNMAMPTTFDELHDVLAAFKTECGATDPIILSGTGAGTENYFCAGYGVNAVVGITGTGIALPYYQVDGQVKFGFYEEAYLEYLSMIVDWYSQGLVINDIMNPHDVTMQYYGDYLATGKSGVFLTEIDFVDPLMAEVEGCVLSPMPEIMAEGVDGSHFGEAGMRVKSNNSVSITTSCETPEYACMVIDYLYSDEGTILCNYGVEGVSFEYVDGKPVYTELITKNPDGYTFTVAMNIYCQQFGHYIWDVDRYDSIYSDKQKECIQVWNTNKDRAYVLPVGLSMTAEENEEYSGIAATLATYCTETILAFITGQKPLSEFDDFKAQCSELGADKGLELWQAAMDRYLSK